MSLPAQFSSLEAAAALPARPLHLAIGMFDGAHLGHRAVIAAAVQAARQSGGAAAVLTFWPHPSALFRPENPTRMIQDGAMKARVLLTLGVDAVITESFTPAVAGVVAEDFLPWLQQRLPYLASVYVGENFRFGRGRMGDVALLAQSGRQHGLRVVSAPRVTLRGAMISSTRIRGLLEAGEIAQANALFGYTYFAEGMIVPGKRLGRTLGFPTLNIDWSPDLKPRFGVYAVRVAGVKSAVGLPAVANYGLRPTVEQSTEPRLEVHVLGPCPFAEGDVIRVDWLRFVRPEMTFSGLEELRGQIEKDRECVNADFSLH
ncbi:MAG: riboflavin biosynthesis protein RibF [Opitutaceae bacterium]|nr:riboflavin biosynthesis protein RibF [Opitutaceae bacterium]